MNTQRLLTGGLVAAAMALVAAPAQAAFTSSISGNVTTMTSNAAADTLVIDQAGGLLRHNRFPTDPGFHGEFDFDSATPGDQTLSATDPAQRVHVNGGDGNDTFTIGSATTPATAIPDAMEFDGGNNTDTINIEASADTTARDFAWTATGQSLVVGTGSWFHPGVEVVNARLGSGGDTVRVASTDPGSTGKLDSGAGDDSFIFGQSGNTLGTVTGPITADGGTGVDSLTFGDSAQPGRHTYRIDSTTFSRDGLGLVTFANAETAELDASAGVDDVFKRGSMPFTIKGGASADNIVTVDSVADTVDCTGGADIAYADLFDTLASNCETANRFDTSPPPEPQPQPQPQPQPMPDKTPPALVVHAPKSVTKKKLLKGVFVTVQSNEASSLAVEERKKLASKSYNLTLAQASLPIASVNGFRSLKLKANRALVRHAKKSFSVRFFVTAVDAAGNRATATRTVKVRPR